MFKALEGVSIWRTAAVEKMRFLVNGEEYYQAIYEQIKKAEKSICILAWQLDFGTRLVRKNPSSTAYSLEEVLLERLNEKPELQVYILVWDHLLLYAQDREKFNQLKVFLSFPSRVHFHLDSEHPFWASHHAKIVIFDGKIAYSGGMDIAVGRWDSSPHLSANPHRVDTTVSQYPPYHDIMVELQGPVLEPLIEYFRARWKFSGCTHALDAVEPSPEALIENEDCIPCYLVRTAPQYKSQHAVHEIEESYLALIRAAKRDIYIENQYISSEAIVNALGLRLKEPDGPYISIILPYLDSPNLEGFAMGTSVGLLIEKLMEHDEFGRLAVYYPLTIDTQEHKVKVHSKLMLVDDETLMIGSANLNERSMGLDTELNFIFSAQERPVVKDHIRKLKKKTLSSFTGREIKDEELSEAALQTILATSKCFRKFREASKSTELKIWAKENLPLDYKDPLAPERILERSIDAGKAGTWKRMVRNFLVVIFIVAAGIYIGSNYNQTVQPMFDAFLGYIETQKLSPVLLVLGFGVLGGIFFPVNLFIIGMGLIFGTLEAILYCLIGVVLASLTSFLLGQWIGIKFFRKVFKRKVSKFYTFFSRSHWTEVAVLRMIPFAPFSFIGLVAGAIEVPLKHFLLGSFAGNLPGVVLLLVFERSLIDFLREPSAQGAILLMALVGFFGYAIYKVKKRFAYAV